MGKFIVKIEDLYFEWSTIVDAPITCGMTENELIDYIQSKYGQEGLDELSSRLLRVQENGTSARGLTLDELIKGNRAGYREQELTKEEIYKEYLGQG